MTDKRLTSTAKARLASAMAGTLLELSDAFRDLGLMLGDNCTRDRMVECYLNLANLQRRHSDERAREAAHYRALAAYEESLPPPAPLFERVTSEPREMTGGDTPSKPSITAAALEAVRKGEQ